MQKTNKKQEKKFKPNKKGKGESDLIQRYFLLLEIVQINLIKI